jgi:hypothetical protein
VRNIDPRKRPLQEAFGNPIIGTSSWEYQQVEELLDDAPLQAILLDNQAGLLIYHLEVPARWHGQPLEELLPENRFERLSWTRRAQSLPIDNLRLLESGDLLYLKANPLEIDALRNRLKSEQEKPT